MIWLTVILIYILNIQAEEDFIKVKKTFFLEHKFWCADQQLKTDKGFLCEVSIDLERKSYDTFNYVYYPKTCYSLKSTNLGYAVLDYSVVKEIDSFLEKPGNDKFFLRFAFLFTDEPIESLYYLEKYKGKIQNCVSYKFIEKKSKNNLKLRCDGTDIHIEHIKDRFEVFLSIDLIRFNEYIRILDNLKKNELKQKENNELKHMENDADFGLNYFKKHSECLESLKEFIEDLCYINLMVDDDISDLFTSNIFVKTTNLKISQFRERLHRKFIVNLKKFYDIEANKTWELFFDDCFYCLKDVMLKNNIFFLAGGKYDINYYIDQLSNLIYKSVKLIISKYGTSIHKCFLSSKITYSWNNDLKNLQVSAMKDLCESVYVPKHFSKLLRNKVETLGDYIEVEKIVCDYYNMFLYIINLERNFNKFSHVSYSYVTPIFIDNFNLNIIDGIKIEFKRPVKFKQIRGFDQKGEKIIMMKDTDYFIDKFGKFCLPSKVLKMKNIHEIEVISFSDTINRKKFKIDKY